jgi:hypothetical protein
MSLWSRLFGNKPDQPSRRADSRREADLRCSFCRKSKADVSKLIASPSAGPEAYICDECIQVCISILDDEGIPRIPVGHPIAIQPGPESSPLLTHPLTPQLLSSIEFWIRQESLGKNAAEELAEVRTIARRMIAQG